MKRLAYLAVLVLAGCGTSPEPDYYDMSAVNGTALPNVVTSLEIERPTLPSYLDRPDFVRQDNAYRYSIDEFQRWAEPLDRMFERILTEDLRQRLPGSAILSEADTGTFKMRYAVESDIQQFNSVTQDGSSTAVLKVTLSLVDKTVTTKLVTDANGAPLKLKMMRQETFQLSIPAGTSPDSIASALSKLVAAYADEVALVLQQQK
jgi:uncharacterized lipoprotein YmbA